MTNLECTAQQCVNNHSRLCALKEIHVNGRDACRCQDTCCGSFMAENAAYSNVRDTRDAAPGTHIGCQVKQCVYNLDGVCDAEEVLIDGSYARRPDGTRCDTFVARG